MTGGGRGVGRVAAGSVLALVLLAGCSQVVRGTGRPGAGVLSTGAVPTGSTPTRSGAPTGTAPRFPSSTPTVTGSGPLTTGAPSSSGATNTAPGPGPSASATVLTPSPTPVAVTCPTVSDTVARIRYACLTTGMTSSPAAGYSANVVLQTESDPDWFMSESSRLLPGVTAESLQEVVEVELQVFLVQSYPAGSIPTISSARATTVDGHPAYEIVGLITVDRTGDYESLKAKQDRFAAMAVVGPTGAALLIMAVPDTAKSLWPKMDTIMTSAQLI